MNTGGVDESFLVIFLTLSSQLLCQDMCVQMSPYLSYTSLIWNTVWVLIMRKQNILRHRYVFMHGYFLGNLVNWLKIKRVGKHRRIYQVAYLIKR